MSLSWNIDVHDKQIVKLVSKAIGEELRRQREALRWSRLKTVSKLPTPIGDRTLLSYEYGTRHLTVIRLIEICWVLGTDASTVMARALQRVCIYIENMPLEIDLRALLKDENPAFRPLQPWVRNTFNEHPDGVVKVDAVVLRNLALFMGCGHQELVTHLAQFLPEGKAKNAKSDARSNRRASKPRKKS